MRDAFVSDGESRRIPCGRRDTGAMGLAMVREFRFEAAHRLAWHPGKCARVHGHSYRLEVTVEGQVDDRGVIMDFADVKAAVNEAVMDKVDHRDLNEVIENPTAERIVTQIGEWLEEAGLTWSSLRLWETASCSVQLTR